MSARVRQSTAGPSATAARDLPPYEPPENPLNILGQRSLHNILKDHNHQKLERHLRQATQALSDNANIINYRLTDRKARDLKRKQRHADSLTDVDEQRAQHLEGFDTRVTAMTKRMEETVRKTIDGQQFAGTLQEEIEHLQAQAARNASASQRPTQSQRRRDDDDDMTDYDPTLPGETQNEPVLVPRDFFEERYQAQKDKYHSLPLPTRYSEHPEYVGFKQAVHEGTYPNGEGPPLAPKTAWFTSAGAPAPGVTQAGDDDSDDDIAVAFERISTKCPLTLKELQDPITSTKCPHTFEREAVMELLLQSHFFTGGSNRRGARDGLRTVQCPVPGCDQMLTQNDLRPNPSLIRKIQRIQKRREEMEDSDDENVENSRLQVIPSDDSNEYDDIDEPASQRIVPKIERASGMSQGPGVGSSRSNQMGYDGTMDSSHIQSSNIVDLGSDSEEEDEE
ncbi:hypothetical protein DIS24_g7893 [Lasiodiplodia hormozganensis]|uniref:SP-RING-type domain-containing protein n=1 Tax=Lasiodiplodia hormozganensis TaxID=869390 RepID=A0AA39Y7D2_9PEZI|nr:hypothetical protein DIS24_g7893 [Lasiodiplodia hormozganensis]